MLSRIFIEGDQFAKRDDILIYRGGNSKSRHRKNQLKFFNKNRYLGKKPNRIL